jgi:hypothetical protein
MNFSLSDAEVERANKFIDEKELEYVGAIGGQFTYEFTITSIGVIKSIKDCVSGDSFILSDFEDF